MSAGRIIALVLALAVAALLVRSWGGRSRARRALPLLAIATLVAIGLGVMPDLPHPEDVIEDIAVTLGPWTYLLVGVMSFAETGAFVGFVAPGEMTVIVAGVIAGQGEIDIKLLIPLVWVCSFIGDSLSFLLGHKLGRDFMLRHGPKFQITPPRLKAVEEYLARHGGKTVVIGRFIGFVRPLAPFIAGASRMPYGRYLPYAVIGTGLWSAAFCLLGYFFWQSFDRVIEYAGRGTLLLGWITALIFATVWLVRHFRHSENRVAFGHKLDELEARRGLRIPVQSARVSGRIARRIAAPLVWFFGPQVRFAWQRFTPGDLGIEFTSAAAITAVAGYGLVFYAVDASDGVLDSAAVQRVNTEAFALANSVQNRLITDVAEIVTYLGSLPVVAAVVGVAVLGFLYKRRLVEPLVIASTLALTVLVVYWLKDSSAVPRPTGPMTKTDGYSFPSGHAAYAVIYVVIAIAIDRIGGLTGKVTLVTISMVLAVAVGLTRVYLRAHFLSDVVGGIAVTFTIAGILACSALVLTHVRALRRRRRAARQG